MFIISLDFELLWGVLDTKGPEYYSKLGNVYHVVPSLLELFKQYEISCTWATVGALFCEDTSRFLDEAPRLKPTYKVKSICNYTAFKRLSLEDTSILFAPALIKKIESYSNQEIASHTFSHYYTLEDGQTLEQFESDLKAQKSVMLGHTDDCNSIVFPRNQINPNYFESCKKFGINSFRGTASHWAFNSSSKFKQSSFARAFRLIDSYIPLWDCSQVISKDSHSGIVNIPASLFLRPYSHRLSFLEKLKIRRIKTGMTKAAKYGRIFHLWWHPHNFGANLELNMKQLEDILKHSQFLKEKYGFESMTMKDAAANFNKERV